MKKVAVVGYGNTKFTKDELPIESLLLESTKQVFDTTKNLSQDLIDGVIVSTNDNSNILVLSYLNFLALNQKFPTRLNICVVLVLAQ